MITKKIKIKFEIGSTVFSKTDPDQYERQITGITLRPTGVLYKVTFNQEECSFYGFELSSEKDVLKSIT
jgi:hypothetical protein